MSTQTYIPGTAPRGRQKTRTYGEIRNQNCKSSQSYRDRSYVIKPKEVASVLRVLELGIESVEGVKSSTLMSQFAKPSEDLDIAIAKLVVIELRKR